MFDDKEIDILAFAESTTDKYGNTIKGQESTVKTIKCDVQPYSKIMLTRDYGYDENVIYRVFCDFDNLLETGKTIKYKGNNYVITKIIPWDDFCEVMIDNE